VIERRARLISYTYEGSFVLVGREERREIDAFMVHQGAEIPSVALKMFSAKICRLLRCGKCLLLCALLIPMWEI